MRNPESGKKEISKQDQYRHHYNDEIYIRHLQIRPYLATDSICEVKLANIRERLQRSSARWRAARPKASR
jgi:hypothetical protein